jgi:hypothetical protein
LTAGDVVIAAFPGAQVTKTRPAVVLSSTDYHAHHIDVIVSLITTNSSDHLSATDWDIAGWRVAGLHAPSRFRLYLATLRQRDVRVIGRLDEDDWLGVQRCVRAGIIGA